MPPAKARTRWEGIGLVVRTSTRNIDVSCRLYDAIECSRSSLHPPTALGDDVPPYPGGIDGWTFTLAWDIYAHHWDRHTHANRR